MFVQPVLILVCNNTSSRFFAKWYWVIMLMNHPSQGHVPIMYVLYGHYYVHKHLVGVHINGGLRSKNIDQTI